VSPYTLLLLLLQVDIIFDDTYSFNSSHLLDIAAFKEAYGLSDAQSADIPAIAAGQVWTFNNRLGARNADGSVGSDWFESSVARPDLVSDILISMFVSRIDLVCCDLELLAQQWSVAQAWSCMAVWFCMSYMQCTGCPHCCAVNETGTLLLLLLLPKLPLSYRSSLTLSR
jgi:hypothetical protein